ncbi:MAG: ATP-binding protein [Sphaerochaetaceae bacterium]|nr:ATP-binding protein [Sphaerochaetaceae bacterium]
MIIKRDNYINILSRKMNNGLVKIITGIRRSGKSFLLFNLFKNYLLEKGVSEDSIISVILDNDFYSTLRNPLTLGKYIRERITDPRKNYYVLIDEIQFVEKIKNPNLPQSYITFYDVLNGLLSYNNVDIYITGSNSKMLSKDILTEFRGRGDQIHIYPLRIKELYDATKESFDAIYDSYSLYGGLPKVWNLDTAEDKSTYLKNLILEVYLMDIKQRNSIKDERNIKTLMEVLASSIGSYTNPTKIENTFKSQLRTTYTQKTIVNHLDYIQDAFLIWESKRYDIKGRKYIGANSKYYYSDIGIRNALLNFRQNEPTHIMENIIYNELISRNYNVDVGIVETYTTRDNKKEKVNLEVDFIASKGNETFYIQSAYSLYEKIEIERRPLNKINESFKKIIIHKDSTNSWYDEKGICYMSLKNFLLSDTL